MDFSWPALVPATDYVGQRPLLMAPQHNNLLLRQTFLRSYQFTVRESFQGRVRRNLKEAGLVGKAILFDVGLKLHKVNPLRCFRPYNKNFYSEAT